MLRPRNSRGDTIVEVLIAITIAGLAIGTAYSIANRSLTRSASARERDQAVGLLEGQLSALKLRQQLSDTATFTSDFTNGGAPADFCLVPSASDASVPSSWLPKKNLAAAPLVKSTADPPNSATAPYNQSCVISGTYFLDITTTLDSVTSTTNYRLDVRWPRLGGGPDNDATFYYRF